MFEIENFDPIRVKGHRLLWTAYVEFGDAPFQIGDVLDEAASQPDWQQWPADLRPDQFMCGSRGQMHRGVELTQLPDGRWKGSTKNTVKYYGVHDLERRYIRPEVLAFLDSVTTRFPTKIAARKLMRAAPLPVVQRDVFRESCQAWEEKAELPRDHHRESKYVQAEPHRESLINDGVRALRTLPQFALIDVRGDIRLETPWGQTRIDILARVNPGQYDPNVEQDYCPIRVWSAESQASHLQMDSHLGKLRRFCTAMREQTGNSHGVGLVGHIQPVLLVDFEPSQDILTYLDVYNRSESVPVLIVQVNISLRTVH